MKATCITMFATMQRSYNTVLKPIFQQLARQDLLQLIDSSDAIGRRTRNTQVSFHNLSPEAVLLYFRTTAHHQHINGSSDLSTPSCGRPPTTHEPGLDRLQIIIDCININDLRLPQVNHL